jgi:hypothetical protein
MSFAPPNSRCYYTWNISRYTSVLPTLFTAKMREYLLGNTRMRPSQIKLPNRLEDTLKHHISTNIMAMDRQLRLSSIAHQRTEDMHTDSSLAIY